MMYDYLHSLRSIDRYKAGFKTSGFSPMFSLRIMVTLFCAFLVAEKNSIAQVKTHIHLGLVLSKSRGNSRNANTECVVNCIYFIYTMINLLASFIVCISPIFAMYFDFTSRNDPPLLVPNDNCNGGLHSVVFFK